MITMKNKTVYFEAAGMDFSNEYSDIGNYRLRTALTNNDNENIYFEIGRTYRSNTKGKVTFEWALRIDHLFILDGVDNDENRTAITRDHKDTRDNYEYTKKSVLKWINLHLNCDYNDLKIADDYHVHGKHCNEYNLMDMLTY